MSELNSVAKLVLNAVVESGGGDTYADYFAKQLLRKDKFESLVYAATCFQSDEIDAFAKNVGVTEQELRHAFKVIQRIYLKS